MTIMKMNGLPFFFSLSPITHPFSLLRYQANCTYTIHTPLKQSITLAKFSHLQKLTSTTTAPNTYVLAHPNINSTYTSPEKALSLYK
jgi:hypothetical protein